ncbi:MAG TPA: response regulator [Saprospiraceae bacterium]|nr:response regulator [Chitinophagales bacterium]HNG14105.1 response regulator [Saprospiraceae bacterium]HNL83757.1 response regulator [Chitinophagales bacterium]
MNTKPLSILLADDDEDDRLFFKDALEECRVKTMVETVNDGIELMNLLLEESTVLPHILFLDLNMPRKNGIECLEDIRKSDRLKHITVAIYSTSGAERDIEDTFVKGANVYIKKPNDFNALKEVLENVLSTKWQFHTSGLNKDTFLLNV